MTKPIVMPIPKLPISIEEFMKERNAVLMRGDMLEMAHFFKKYNPGFDGPELKEEALEVAMHIARVGVRSLPEEVKESSRQWLTDHGHSDLLTTPTFNLIKEQTDAQEAQILPTPGTSSHPDDHQNPEPEQPAVDEAAVAGSSGEAPTG